MILEFSVENFKSIKDKQTLSMLSSSLKENLANTFTYSNNRDNFNLLKFSAIFGANGSGKSNLLESIDCLKNFVLNSTDTKVTEKIGFYYPFKLDEECSQKPTKFEIEFINSDKIRYKYGVSYNNIEILEEYLFYYPNRQEAKLFVRKKNKAIDYGESLKGSKKIIEQQLLNSVLFLSKGANSNNSQLESIYTFFKFYLRTITGEFPFPLPIDLNYIQFSGNMYSKFLKQFDIGIEEVKYIKEDSELTKSVAQSLAKGSFEKGSQSEKIFIESVCYKPELYHKRYNNKKQEIGKIGFGLGEESMGTQKLYFISSIIIQTLKNGGTLFIDEFNNSFHVMLSRALIEIFKDTSINEKNAQLIFTTHDSSILGNNLFRRDQIWFTEKDQYGATTLFSMAEFKNKKLRFDTPLDKWYLSGRFGGLPYINDLKLELSDAKEKNN